MSKPDWHQVARWQLRATWSKVLEGAPSSWSPYLRRTVDDATMAEPVWHRATAARDVLEDWQRRFPGIGHADMSHAEISHRADELAKEAKGLGLGSLREGADPWPEWSRLCAWIERQHGSPPVLHGDVCLSQQLAGLVRRAQCPRWWRRQLRRYVARAAEAAAVELGIVSAATRQLYCSDRSVQRRQRQQAANAAALKSRTVENGGGQRYSLWDVMQLNVSNKAIRRGELMTRIRGAEEIADELELEGLFWTLTTPSRFHSRDHRTGHRNPRYQAGLTPRHAQEWLRAAWSSVRTRLKDRGIRIMGVRVAEPHHDGCPHWHMLMWCRAEHVEPARDLITRTWLEDEGSEPGARRHRSKWVRMERGGAAGYVAKYVAKNIDAPLFYDGQPVHLDHVDDIAPPLGAEPDMLGGTDVTPASRVEAWAAAWSIRQFQIVGMPSVTVWRELRRVHPNAIQDRGDSDLEAAWQATHRNSSRRADWAAYCRAQGGVMLKRSEYRARLKLRQVQRQSGYDTGQLMQVPVGVTTDRTEELHQYAPSMRQPWGGEGFGARMRAAWTRLNNCGPDGRRLHPYVHGDMWRFGRAAWEPRPPPGPAYFDDQTPFADIAAELEARNRTVSEVPLPPQDAPAPAPRYAAPQSFDEIRAALLARAGGYPPSEG